MKCKTNIKYIAKMAFKYTMAIIGFIVVWSLSCAFIENIEISKPYIMSYGTIAFCVSDSVYRSIKTIIQNSLKIKDDQNEM